MPHIALCERYAFPQPNRIKDASPATRHKPEKKIILSILS